MKILPLREELLHADGLAGGRTDGQKDGEADEQTDGQK